LTGAVTFQVPTGIAIRDVEWAPDMFTGKTALWKISG
jgi:hypothetical protein